MYLRFLTFLGMKTLVTKVKYRLKVLSGMSYVTAAKIIIHEALFFREVADMTVKLSTFAFVMERNDKKHFGKLFS